MKGGDRQRHVLLQLPEFGSQLFLGNNCSPKCCQETHVSSEHTHPASSSLFIEKLGVPCIVGIFLSRPRCEELQAAWEPSSCCCAWQWAAWLRDPRLAVSTINKHSKLWKLFDRDVHHYYYYYYLCFSINSIPFSAFWKLTCRKFSPITTFTIISML